MNFFNKDFYSKISNQNILVGCLIAVAIFSRLIPHPWNMTAVVAATLFAGARLSKTMAFVISFGSLFLSDLVLGLHSTMFFTYGALALIAILSAQFLKSKKDEILPTLGTAFLSSAVFFVVSNLGVWLVDGMYPMTAAGLGTCFVMAVPFYKTQIVGDILFSGVLFYTFQALKQNLFVAVSQENK